MNGLFEDDVDRQRIAIYRLCTLTAQQRADDDQDAEMMKLVFTPKVVNRLFKLSETTSPVRALAMQCINNALVVGLDHLDSMSVRSSLFVCAMASLVEHWEGKQRQSSLDRTGLDILVNLFGNLALDHPFNRKLWTLSRVVRLVIRTCEELVTPDAAFCLWALFEGADKNRHTLPADVVREAVRACVAFLTTTEEGAAANEAGSDACAALQLMTENAALSPLALAELHRLHAADALIRTWLQDKNDSAMYVLRDATGVTSGVPDLIASSILVAAHTVLRDDDREREHDVAWIMVGNLAIDHGRRVVEAGLVDRMTTVLTWTRRLNRQPHVEREVSIALWHLARCGRRDARIGKAIVHSGALVAALRRADVTECDFAYVALMGTIDRMRAHADADVMLDALEVHADYHDGLHDKIKRTHQARHASETADYYARLANVAQAWAKRMVDSLNKQV